MLHQHVLKQAISIAYCRFVKFYPLAGIFLHGVAHREEQTECLMVCGFGLLPVMIGGIAVAGGSAQILAHFGLLPAL